MAALRYWVIIPAAGISQRMGAAVPKQYLPLANTTVIEASLSNFLQHPNISGVIVALHANDQYWNNLNVTKNEKIHTVVGGNSRAESVHNAMQYLENTPAEDRDFVLVHDAARPCLRFADLELLMKELEQDEVGGILASPMSDTLKMGEKNAESSNVVSKTLDRENVWRAYTPQMFRFNTLKKALAHCSKKDIKVTDEASAVEHLGLQVKLVKGQSDNIKITHAEDLELATAIFKIINQ
jgi:2-C-methyl-D-erythritol 4-phosphate cytidylyltransferase